MTSRRECHAQDGAFQQGLRSSVPGGASEHGTSRSSTSWRTGYPYDFQRKEGANKGRRYSVTTFRAFLIVLWAIIAGYTAIVTANHGLGLLNVFFGDMATPWVGPASSTSIS